MRVTDWRSDGGLDVIAHLLFAAGGLDRGTLAAVMEARRLMLTEAARLAAERRSDDQAERLVELADARSPTRRRPRPRPRRSTSRSSPSSSRRRGTWCSCWS